MCLEFSLCTNILQVPRQDMNLCTNVFIVSAEGFELKFYPKPDTSPAAHEGRALSASASAVVRRHSSELCPSRRRHTINFAKDSLDGSSA